MSKSCWLLAFALLLSTPAVMARDAAPSESSLRELMAITNARDTFDAVMAQMDGAMKASVEQMTAGEPLNPAQRELVAQMSRDVMDLLKQEMAWDKLEPDMLGVYRASFTQAEVDGMLAFYRSDVGKALIAKMPAVLQNSMNMTQGRLAAVLPRLQALQKDYAAKMAAAK